MKVKSVELENFAKFGKVSVSFDESLTYLIGYNGAGKSSVGITALWFVLQGISERPATKEMKPIIGERFRFIGDAGAVAKGTLKLYDETTKNEITIVRKMTKDGTQVVINSADGQSLDQSFLNSLFNEFLIAPKRFLDLTSKEQTKALGIDTSEFDKKIVNLKSEYTLLNSAYKNFGEIAVVEKVDVVDISEKTAKKTELNQKRGLIVDGNRTKRLQYEADVKNPPKEITEFNEAQDKKETEILGAKHALTMLVSVGYRGNEVFQFISAMPKAETKKQVQVPEYADETIYDAEITAIDTQITEAAATNTKASTYAEYIKKTKAKADKFAEMTKNQEAQKAEQGRKDKYLSERELPFANLSINDEGELLLKEKPIKEPFFSTGELLKVVPILLSSQNPNLKYVFLQNFDLIDPDNQTKIIDYLISEGFQLVIEHIGAKAIDGKNSIVLKDCKIVKDEPETTTENQKPEL